MPNGYFTTDQIDFNEIWYQRVLPGIDMYNRVDVPVLGSLSMPLGEEIFKYGISNRNGFQRLGMGERPDHKLIAWGTMYPFVEKFGYGVGTDRDTLLRSTGRVVRANLERPFLEDPESVFIQMMKKMMTNPSTSNAGYGFWNGEYSAEENITAPPTFMQTSFAANHSHYYRTGAASIVLGDISAAKQTIRHHGNRGKLVCFINSVEQQALEVLATFTNTALQVHNPISDSVAINGFETVFTLLGVEFYVTEMMPAGYFLMVQASPVEGDRPLIHFEPRNLKGLNVFPGGDAHYPLIESYFERWMGFKVWSRGAGVAVQIATAGSYTNPIFTE